MKVMTVVGARPQFIKAEPVARAIVESGHQHVLVHTGQHWDFGMSQVFFDEMGIEAPAINLSIGSAPHGRQTGHMLEGLERVMIDERPDWVIVLGDTNSTLAGALAAVKLHLPVAHVEAGLRSFNRRMPEEINRVLTDHAADLLFAPTEIAVRNLSNEGIFGDRVQFVGDVMYDAFRRFLPTALTRSRIRDELGLRSGSYVLATVHRAENTDDAQRLATIFTALRSVAECRPVVVPLHPRTREALRAAGTPVESLAPVRIIEPLGYLDMLALISSAAAVASDSGGIQKEAFFARVPCVTLRNETEWVELVDNGWNRLCPPTAPELVTNGILAAVGTTGSSIELYGEGQCATRIARSLTA
jgi:UDP-GlcNAc3NAcA epimerase